MLARVFELKEEVDTFLLSEFNKPEFVSHLAYLTVILEALNELLMENFRAEIPTLSVIQITLMASFPKLNSGVERS